MQLDLRDAGRPLPDMRFVKKITQLELWAKKTLKANNFNFVLVRLLDKNRGTKSTLMLIDELWDIGEHFFCCKIVNLTKTDLLDRCKRVNMEFQCCLLKMSKHVKLLNLIII